MFLKIFFLILTVQKSFCDDQTNILCSAKTCTDYRTKNPCVALPENCKIQNSTHNGLMLPSNDPCNCCQFCLINLKEGDFCTIGAAGDIVPDSICGPGLTCIGGYCKKMTENPKTIKNRMCITELSDYIQDRKDGTLGSMQLKPQCDDHGFYLPYKCVPGQSCFCVDKNGNRIFGEIPYTTSALLTSKCACSRKYYEILKFFDRDSLHPNEHFRCTSTGDYDTIQCIGDDCMCTDASDGAPTWPKREAVNIQNISSISLPDCFNKEVHLSEEYYYSCAAKYLEILNQVNDYIKAGYNEVFNVVYPDCDLDGKYKRVQSGLRKNEENQDEVFYFCADPDGQQIENFESNTNTKMDCNCARTNLILPKDSIEKPQCCSNGNFNPIQCRRGKCYCVDENGYQQNSPSEVNIENVSDLDCKVSCVL